VNSTEFQGPPVITIGPGRELSAVGPSWSAVLGLIEGSTRASPQCLLEGFRLLTGVAADSHHTNHSIQVHAAISPAAPERVGAVVASASSSAFPAHFHDAVG